MAYVEDFQFDCAVHVEIAVQLYDAETGTTPLDLSGVTEIRYRIAKQVHGDWPVLLEKMYSDDGITIDGVPSPELGAITIHITPEDTLDTATVDMVLVELSRLTGIYEHELRVTDATGNVTALFTGRCTINPTGPL